MINADTIKQYIAVRWLDWRQQRLGRAVKRQNHQYSADGADTTTANGRRKWKV
jgi:hypothetical protein